MPATSTSSSEKPARPVVYYLWWRPWALGVSCLMLVLLSLSAAAQVTPPKPPPKPPLKPAPPAATKESEAVPLPPKKLEEALRLLLQAVGDSSAGQERRQFKATEIDGLVMDQTISKFGHDFYDEFYTHWEVPPGVTDFTIVVREKPARGTSTLISLEVNDNELLELPLQPKAEVVEELAAYALSVAQEFLARARDESRQLERGGRVPPEVF
ncbi:curli production assembly/transport protein CsgE [Hymenobacter sp. NST-14]|uniref:curli production assembly/transport protein CsgE n=1 Tax=Hymenobacter piscis TaxID=2839984 RepID=UPI001C010FB8|nr:curli production assembly/transport protein CsgE [Hymenobacter piscis]MBT9393802.1 curli production assembly/transport protein CsgE [Hymenobacter piscis]